MTVLHIIPLIFFLKMQNIINHKIQSNICTEEKKKIQ